MLAEQFEARYPLGLAGGAPGAAHELAQAAPHVGGWIGVDGGADLLLAEGVMPRAVVGDLDSLSGRARAAFADRLHPVAEQETTDFEKALSRTRAPLVLAVGFTGGRFDHELAVMNVLVRHPARRCIVLGRETLAFHCPDRVRLDLPPGALVSLFPLVPLRVDSTGLRWPTEGLRLAPDGRIGTSNAATGPVTLRPRARGLLVILRAAALAAAVRALMPG